LAWLAAVALVGLSAMAGPASATLYSLGGDFSNASNPNGVWSFTQGTTALTHYPQPSISNTLNPAAGNGYWGVGPSFNTDVPIVLKATVDGATTGAYNNNDFLTGDVIVHSPNAGAPLFINWTAPAAGSINFSSEFWYAHSPVDRSNTVSVLLGGSLITSPLTLDNTSNRSNPDSITATGFPVTAGEVLAFAFDRSAGQPFGSIDGITETVNFTPSAVAVPEPAGWTIILLGIGAMGAALRGAGRKPAGLVLAA
jgi:hypothetical protein